LPILGGEDDAVALVALIDGLRVVRVADGAVLVQERGKFSKDADLPVDVLDSRLEDFTGVNSSAISSGSP
jgi:CHASE1-domain containing sensor protein